MSGTKDLKIIQNVKKYMRMYANKLHEHVNLKNGKG